MAKRPCPFNSLSSLGEEADFSEFIGKLQSLIENTEDSAGSGTGRVGGGWRRRWKEGGGKTEGMELEMSYGWRIFDHTERGSWREGEDEVGVRCILS